MGAVVLLGLTAYTVVARGPSATVGMDSAGRYGAVRAQAVPVVQAAVESGTAAPSDSAPTVTADSEAVPSSAETTQSAAAPTAPLAGALSTQGIVATPPATITRDCSRNVTGPLNSWMASIADGATLRFPVGACYRVDGTLVLTDRRDLVIDGQGASFTASVVPPASPKITRQMWSVVGGRNITIRNMSLKGTNPTATFHVEREWFPLIQIAGTQTALVEGVRGSNSWGDFVSIGPDVRRVANSDGTPVVYPKDVTVRGSTASVIGRHGITCNGCENVLVDGNAFSDVAYQILDVEVEATAWHARHVALTNNTIGGRVNLSVLANAGIGHDVTDVT